MANYLMPSSGAPSAPVTSNRGRDDIISVDDMYRLRIYNKSRTIEFGGFVPPEFNIAISAQWQAPFSDVSLMSAGTDITGSSKLDAASNALGGAAKAAKFAGGSTINVLQTGQVWTGPSFLTLDLPILLDAYADSKKEVVEPLVQLLSLCAPELGTGGMLIPPGPSPAATLANSVGSKLGAGEILSNGEEFTVEIGNFFTMQPCIITSSSSQFENIWEDGSGNPISVDFVLQISSYFAVTREDLRQWFHLT